MYNSQLDQDKFKVYLVPGEELAYNSSNKTFQKNLFNYEEKIAWEDGILYFRDDNINTIIRKIEQWYGVSVQIRNIPEKQWYFTGMFKDQSLKNVLEGMAYSKNFEYSIDGKKVYLDFKK